jgi:hypothetical protein
MKSARVRGATVVWMAETAVANEPADAAPARRFARLPWLEILEAALLATVAIATAWSSYEAGIWSARQTKLYGISSRDRVLATQASTLSGQERLYDSSVFSSWLQATATGNRSLAQLYERRFRPAFRPAFTAWLATDPFHNRSAPAGPQLMPQYRNASEQRAAALNSQAGAHFNAGSDARSTSDRYLRVTLLLATVLFLTAIAQRFTTRAVRIGLLVVSAGILVLALVFIGTYPRA